MKSDQSFFFPNTEREVSIWFNGIHSTRMSSFLFFFILCIFYQCSFISSSQNLFSFNLMFSDFVFFYSQIAVRPEHATRNFTVVANYLLVDENWRKKTAVVSPSKISAVRFFF